MKKVMAIGGMGKALLPVYRKQIQVLESTDLIHEGDVVLIGHSQNDWHAWIKLDSIHTGKCVKDLFGEFITVGRVIETEEAWRWHG